jgi:tetratricopeptide (TPR) repeat protein
MMDGTAYAALLAEAQADLRDGRLADAELKFATLCEDSPNRSAGFSGLADVAAARSDWRVALERWQICLERFPVGAPLRWRLSRAWALLHTNRPHEAESNFRALCEAAPQNSWALSGLAHSLMHQRRWAEAVVLWDQLIEHSPTSLRQPGGSPMSSALMPQTMQHGTRKPRLTCAAGGWPMPNLSSGRCAKRGRKDRLVSADSRTSRMPGANGTSP